MPSVTVVHPRGETTRSVSSVAELNTYVINRGWGLQTGTYADAYQTVTGQSYAPPTKTTQAVDFGSRGDVFRAVTAREPSLVSSVHPSPPTVFTYPQASNPIASPVSWYPQAGGIELLGCVPSTPAGATYPTTNLINGQTADAEKMAWGPGFVLVGGNQVAIRWRSAVTGAYQHVEVDGRLLTLDPVLPVDAAGATLPITANTWYVTVLTFPAVGTYRIKFYGRRWGVRDVMVAPTAGISPLNEKRLRVACVTASFGAGGPAVASELDGWPWGFGRILGMDVAQCSIGGSGLLAPVPFGAESRMAPLVAYGPDTVAVELAGNDLDVAGATPASVTAAFVGFLDQMNTRLPGVPVVVFGLPPRNASFSIHPGLREANPLLEAAAAAAPNCVGFHDYTGARTDQVTYTTGAAYPAGTRALYNGSVWECRVPVANAPAVLDTAYWRAFSHYTGTGQVGLLAGNGTRDVLVHSDGTHPTKLGQRGLEQMYARDFRADLAAIS